MGLGKTVQTLAHLLLEKQQGRDTLPTLIVAPTSLMGNWRREAERFTPDLSLLLLHGIDRKEYLEKLNDYNIILTTYALIRRDLETLQNYRFHYIVLDEAQAIKNPKSLTTQGVCSLKSNHRLCLTGTPMENHLGELWSMYHFLMPGYLGPMNRFTRQFRNPIEKEGDGTRMQQLQKRIKPFLLRRTKQAVAQELPEKTEIVRSIILDGKQRDLYESIRLSMDKKVRDEIRKKGLARSHIMILDALLKLRQVCCDPHLVALDRAKKVKQSAKMDLLMEMLPEMIEEGRKILIFSQFTKMLAIIENAIQQQHITYSKLTGQTRKRDEAIDYFQNGPAKVMLISLKAGGVGLNLTAADTVIHYDPWWNPAVENQATDRAHRIGQDKSVFVYKLICENTVEDKIIALQQKKQALADNMYGDTGKAQQGPLLSAEDLENLLKPIE
jgi:SNF2 family DNA or RNA helicase